MSEPQHLPQPFMSFPQMAVATPQYVFNSFGLSFSASEFVANLLFENRPLTTLIMPPVIAKSFAQAILHAVTDYEKATGQEIQSVSELIVKIQTHKAASV